MDTVGNLEPATGLARIMIYSLSFDIGLRLALLLEKTHSYLKISFYKIIIEIYFHHFLLCITKSIFGHRARKITFSVSKTLIKVMIYYQSISSLPLHMTDVPDSLLHNLASKKNMHTGYYNLLY